MQELIRERRERGASASSPAGSGGNSAADSAANSRLPSRGASPAPASPVFRTTSHPALALGASSLGPGAQRASDDVETGQLTPVHAAAQLPASPQHARAGSASGLVARGSNSALANAVSAANGMPSTPPLQRALKIKPKKVSGFGGASSRASTPSSATDANRAAFHGSGLRRSASTSGLKRQDADEVDSALADGLVAESDINHYGMRTPWAGASSACLKLTLLMLVQWQMRELLALRKRASLGAYVAAPLQPLV